MSRLKRKPLTDAHRATALAAAAAAVGISPDQVFESIRGASKARVLAARALVVATGAIPSDVAWKLRLNRSQVAPSAEARYGVQGLVAGVVASLRDAGLEVFGSAADPARPAVPQPQPPTSPDVALTAAHMATALVAAAAVVGIRPDLVFEPVRGAGKARVLAARALIVATGARPADVGRMLRLSRSQVAPSAEAEYGVQGLVAGVVTALRDAGLAVFQTAPEPARPAATPPEPATGKSERAALSPAPLSPAPAERPARPTPAERRALPAVPKRQPARREPAPRPGVSAPAERAAVLRPVVAMPRPASSGDGGSRSGGFGAIRLKRISGDILRWSRAYVAQGVAPAYLAELFGVDPDELAAAVATRAEAA